MQTQRIRTTISLPETIHRQLKEESFKKNISLNKLMLEKLTKKKTTKSTFKIKAFNVGVRGKLRRKDIYAEILDRKS